MEGAVWQLKRPSGLGSGGRGRPGEGVGGSLCSRPGSIKARTDFIKYKTREEDFRREICKIQYLRGLAIIKNKVHYLQTISVLGLCTVEGGVGWGGCGCVCVWMSGAGGSGLLVIMREEEGWPSEWFI